MEASKDSYQPNALPTTSAQQQAERRLITESWEPNGFARYEYQKALLEGMPVLGGLNDSFMGNPARYELVPPHMEEDFPVRQPKGTKKKEKSKP